MKAVIFDWAGTTVDFGSIAPMSVFLEVFRREGVEITIEEARRPMGAHKRDHIRLVTQDPAVQPRWIEAKGTEPTEEDVERMFQAAIPLQVDCLADHADPIPGALDTVAACRQRGMKIGSSTGYTTEMIEVLVVEAKKRGYAPDSVVCASDVPAGRPAPWMCFENAQRLGVYPMEAIVKVDDTTPGIVAGRNAGMWTVGIARTGNEMGFPEAELARLDAADYDARLSRAYAKLYQAGADFVIDGVADLMPCLDEIERRLARGERP